MERLASKMADAYCENGFWIDLDIIAEYLGIEVKSEGASIALDTGTHTTKCVR